MLSSELYYIGVITYKICYYKFKSTNRVFIIGDYTKALSIDVTEVVTKIALFYVHERIWYKIKLGTSGIAKVDTVETFITRASAVARNLPAATNAEAVILPPQL